MRQLGAMARWLLVGVVVLGSLVWWWPSYLAWGALSAGVLIVLAIWLVWKIAGAERSIPGHPLHLALLGPAGVLLYHFITRGLLGEAGSGRELQGELNLSVLWHVGILSGLLLLSQSLLPRAGRRVGLVAMCGVAMSAGPIVALWLTDAHEARDALGLLGLAGVAVWLTPLWQTPSMDKGLPTAWLVWRRLRWLHVAAALAGAVLLGLAAPRAVLLAAGLVGCVLLVAGGVFHRGRWRLLAPGLCLAAGALAGGWFYRPALGLRRGFGAGPFGVGEKAFSQLSGADSGVTILGGMVGWVGLLLLLGGSAASLVWLMRHAAERRGRDRARAVAWCAGAVLAMAALLCRGGLFMPAVSLALGFTWGLMPAMLGRTVRTHHRAWLLLPFGLGAGLLLLAPRTGIVGWSVQPLIGSDKAMHGVLGFYLAMVTLWVTGRRSIWMGLGGVALAALSGGAAEMAQQLAGRRSAEWADWGWHAAGCAMAMAPYLLMAGARWCESQEVQTPDALRRYQV